MRTLLSAFALFLPVAAFADNTYTAIVVGVQGSTPDQTVTAVSGGSASFQATPVQGTMANQFFMLKKGTAPNFTVTPIGGVIGAQTGVGGGYDPGETPTVTLTRIGQSIPGLSATATAQVDGSLTLSFSGSAGNDSIVDVAIAEGVLTSNTASVTSSITTDGLYDPAGAKPIARIFNFSLVEIAQISPSEVTLNPNGTVSANINPLPAALGAEGPGNYVVKTDDGAFWLLDQMAGSGYTLGVNPGVVTITRGGITVNGLSGTATVNPDSSVSVAFSGNAGTGSAVDVAVGPGLSLGNLSAIGFDYDGGTPEAAPAVTISGADKGTLAGTSSINVNGTVDVAFTGAPTGTGNLTVQVADGVLRAPANLSSIGSGFDSGEAAPTVTITGVGGLGSTAATAYAYVSPDTSGVNNVSLAVVGKGYAHDQLLSVTFQNGGGFGAKATANVVGGAVTSLTLLDAGQDYDPSDYANLGGKAMVSFTGGGGSGAKAIANIDAVSGQITGFNLIDGGADYTSAPTVRIASAGGYDGTGEPVLTTLQMSPTGTQVIDTVDDPITITNPGSGFGTSVTISALGGGTGASAKAVVDYDPTSGNFGQVTGLTLTSAGSGYASAPVVTVTGPGGNTSASYQATISVGQVTGFQQISAGSGYAPSVTVDAPDDPVNPNSQQAVVKAVVEQSASSPNFGQITDFVIISGGRGYIDDSATRNLTASLAGNTATATATIDPGGLSFQMDDGGTPGDLSDDFPIVFQTDANGYEKHGAGYSKTPDVVISAPTFNGVAGAVQAQATATIQSGEIQEIAVSNAGSGFAETATLSVSGSSGGSGATIDLDSVNSTTGALQSIAILSGGSGYQVGDAVIFNGAGHGSPQAEVASVDGSGIIQSFTVINGGSNFQEVAVDIDSPVSGVQGVGFANVDSSGEVSGIDVRRHGFGYQYDDGVPDAFVAAGGDADPTVLIDEDGAGTVAGTATVNGNGTLNVAFTGIPSSTVNLTVTLTQVVDDPPVVGNAIADVAVNEDAPNTTINLSNLFNDEDDANASITKSATSSDSSLVMVAVSGNTLTLDYQADQNGTATVTVTGTSNGQTVDDVFTVTVTGVDDPPAITQGAGPLTFTITEDSGLVSWTNWDKRFGGSAADKLWSVVTTADGGYLLAGESESLADGDKSEAGQGLHDYWSVRIDAIGSKLWDKRFGGTSYDPSFAAVPTVDGGYLLGGYSNSGAGGDRTDPSRGGGDVWPVRIDASGTKVWDRRFGGSAGDVCMSVLATADGGFVLGGYSDSGADGDKSEASQGGNDYWAVKIDASGTKIWDKRFGGSGSDTCRAVVATTDGGYLLAGYSDSGADGDRSEANRGSYADFWAVKIDASGTKVWDRRFGGGVNDVCYSAVATKDGGFLLVGTSNSGADGDKSEAARGNNDFWAIKIDDNGDKVWDKRFGGAVNDICMSVAVDDDGGFLLAGYSDSGADGDKSEASRGGNDFWMVKIDALGNKLWDRLYGGSLNDICNAATVTTDGGYLLAGYSASGADGDKTEASRGGDDYWAIKIGADGSLAQPLTATDGDGDNLTWSVLTPPSNGTATVTGTGSSPTTFSYQPDPDFNGTDSFVVQVSDGTVTDTITVDVNVTGVDDAPTVGNAIADVTATEDDANSTIDLTNVFNDEDDANASITKAAVSSDSSLVTVTVSGDTLTLDYQADQFGAAAITVTATSNGQTVDDVFTVTVTGVDDSPVVGNAIADVAVNEDAPNTTINLSNLFNDVDDANASITKAATSSDSSLVTVAVSGDTLTLDYQADQFGSANITVTGTSNGQTVDDVFTVTVTSANDPPAITQGAGPLTFTINEDSGPVSWLNWNKRFGGSVADHSYAVAATTDGGYLLTGLSNSNASGDKSETSRGGNDYWAVKVSANGTKVWDKSFGGSAYDNLRSVISTSDGGYLLAGYSTSGADGDKTQVSQGSEDYWVVKIDANGTKVWDKSFGGSAYDNLRSVISTSDGGYLLAGHSSSGADGDKSQASQGGYDYWVVKIDANGSKVWDKTYGGSGNDNCESVVVTAEGGFLLAGYSDSPADGDKSETSRGILDYWVVKIDANGNKVWDRRFGGALNDYCRGVFATSDGSYLLAGKSVSGADGDKSEANRGYFDYWAVKIDANGAKVWDKTFGGNNPDVCVGVVETFDGGYLFTGESESGATGDKSEVSRGGKDYWIVKVDSSGNKNWDKRFGGSGGDSNYGIITTSDGGFLLAGNSDSPADGDKTEASRGDYDFWAVKIDANGSLAQPLTATDGDGDNLTWSLLTPPSNGTATVTGTGASPTTFSYQPDGNFSGTDSFVIQVSDGTVTDTITVDVNVTGVNDPPVITSYDGNATATVNVPENQTFAADVNASDADGNETVSYSISGGADAGKFDLNASTGALTFKTAPDYDVPTDADANNTYVVEVTARDGPPPLNSSNYSIVSAGSSHALFIKSDGSVWGMGSNNKGQLADGTTTQRNAPIQLPVGKAIGVEGFHHSLFLKQDGSVLGAGYNWHGELADGTNVDRHQAVTIFNSEVTWVAPGAGSSAYLKNDGTFWVSGSNDYGKFGNGGTTDAYSVIQISEGDVLQVRHGWSHALIVKKDGSALGAGYNQKGELGVGDNGNQHSWVTIFPGDVMQVAAGENHSVFLKSDGSVWTTGWNADGELGLGDNNVRRTPEMVVSSGGVQVSAGGFSTAYVKEDGSLYVMGRINGSNVPVQIEASGVLQASVYNGHGLYLKADGSLWAFGENGSGQLGVGDTTARPSPVEVATGLKLPASAYTLKDAQTITVKLFAPLKPSTPSTPSFKDPP